MLYFSDHTSLSLLRTIHMLESVFLRLLNAAFHRLYAAQFFVDYLFFGDCSPKAFEYYFFSDHTSLSLSRTIHALASVSLRLLSLTFFMLHISQRFTDNLSIDESSSKAFDR